MGIQEPQPSKKTSHYAAHGSAVIRIGLVSILGILASFGFQIVTARTLGPEEFGILSAFFAIVNMAAIGSSSLQNSVAVQTARSIASGGKQVPAKRGLDGYTIEALTLGGAGTLIVLAGSPLIVAGLQTEYYVPLLAAISILLSFVFARAVGTIQGTGKSEGAVWWSTISLVLRVALVASVFAAGLGLVGALAAVLIASAVAMIGALIHARRLNAPILHKPFRIEGVVVLLLTVLFAWLTNVDVILVRAEASGSVAGLYAAGAMLVKAGFLIPSTLSLYLLPRFVRQERNKAMTRLGVRLTLITTATGGILMVAFFAIIGGWAMKALLGPAFAVENLLLASLSLAYLPWIMAQGLLIRMSALSSRVALLVLGIATVIQWFVGSAVLPDIASWLVVVGTLGFLVLIAFLVIDRIHSLKQDATERSQEDQPVAPVPGPQA